ncbi:MAG: methyl-accepting chemotaxis protein, partial [Treponema sp.]|nr:methyl-accepting chemotaxis protein [Treponema sp.]
MRSIRFKVVILIMILAAASFIGFITFIINGTEMREMAGNFSDDFNEALVQEHINEFNAFLDSIQASSGISQTLGETFHSLKDSLSRRELMQSMLDRYRIAFAREPALLGGGGFYEPYAFYPDEYDFHCFVSKVLDSSGTLPTEKNVQWAGDEFIWDVDTYEEGWYLSALPKGWDRSRPRETRFHWSDLYVDTSVNVLMVSVCMPIYSKTQLMVGVATVDVSLSTLQKMVSAFSLATPSTQIFAFSTINEATFASTGSDSYEIVPYPAGSWLNVLSQLEPGQKYFNENFIYSGGGNNNNDENSYTLQASVHSSGIGLAVLVPNVEKMAAVNNVQRTNMITFIIICLVMLGIVIITIVALSYWVVNPIKNASKICEVLAKGDLTQNIAAKGNDELATMLHTLNETQQGIKNLVLNIKDEADDLSSIGADLSANMNETAASVNQITANIHSIKSKALYQSSSITETASTMEQVINNFDKLNEHVENQSANITQASSAIEEMVANIQSVTQTLVRNTANVKELMEASELGRDGLQDVA